MKKHIMTLTLPLILAACSANTTSSNSPQTDKRAIPDVNVAFQECQNSVGNKNSAEELDACMQKKGFERLLPVDRAYQTCLNTVGDRKQKTAEFDSCMEKQGFKRRK